MLIREQKEKKKMSQVLFTVTDGLKPEGSETSVFRPIGLRTPVPINLELGNNRGIRLGVSCNVPLLVVTRGTKQATLFPPNQELGVTLLAASEPLNMSDGEVVADAYLVGSSDVFDVVVSKK